MGSFNWTGILDTVDADTAAVAAAMSPALATSAAFMVETGAAVLPGHAEVVGPAGDPPDSDAGGRDASDV
jgi:hypothetical protein